MDIKLIAVDLDGTLLNERKEIPAGFFELVTRLHQRGVRTVIASGRQYFNLLNTLKETSKYMHLVVLMMNSRIIFNLPYRD